MPVIRAIRRSRLPRARLGTRILRGAATAPPAGIQFVNSSTAKNDTGAASLVVNNPSGIADGQLLLLLVCQNNATTTLDALSGWTDVPGVTWPLDSGTSRMYARYRFASSEPASYTLNWTGGTPKGIGTILAYSGVDGTTPFDANAVGAAESVSQATHTTGNLTTVTDQAWLVSFFADRAGTSGTWTEPAGDIERVDITVTGTSQDSCEIADTNAGVTINTYSKAATSTVATANATMLLIALRPTSTGGHTVTANQAIETETAQTVSSLKVKAAAQATETETAQAVTARKTITVGQALETETGQAVGHAKAKAITQAVETETAQTVGHGAKIIAVGQAVETETGQTPSVRKTITANQAIETETAQTVGRGKVKAAGQAVETETGQQPVARKTRALTQAVETETGQIIQPSGPKLIAIGQAIETETAQTLGKVKLRALAQAAETEASQTLARLRSFTVGQALELETALAVTTGVTPSSPPGVAGAGVTSGRAYATSSSGTAITLDTSGTVTVGE